MLPAPLRVALFRCCVVALLFQLHFDWTGHLKDHFILAGMLTVSDAYFEPSSFCSPLPAVSLLLCPFAPTAANLMFAAIAPQRFVGATTMG